MVSGHVGDKDMNPALHSHGTRESCEGNASQWFARDSRRGQLNAVANQQDVDDHQLVIPSFVLDHLARAGAP